jgi:hypothetical protein
MRSKKKTLLKKKEPKTNTIAWMQQRKNMEQRIIDLHHLLDDAHTPDVDKENELYRLEQLWFKRYGNESWRSKL